MLHAHKQVHIQAATPFENFGQRFQETFGVPPNVFPATVSAVCGPLGEQECYALVAPRFMERGELAKMGFPDPALFPILPVHTWHVPPELQDRIFRGIPADAENRQRLLIMLRGDYPFLKNIELLEFEGQLHITKIQPGINPRHVFSATIADKIQVYDTADHAICIPKIVIESSFS